MIDLTESFHSGPSDLHLKILSYRQNVVSKLCIPPEKSQLNAKLSGNPDDKNHG